MDMDQQRRIRERAYEIWEREGRPEGRDREHWQQAAAEIAAAERAAGASLAPEAPPTPTPAAPTRRSRPVPRRATGNGATTRRKPEAP